MKNRRRSIFKKKIVHQTNKVAKKLPKFFLAENTCKIETQQMNYGLLCLKPWAVITLGPLGNK
jgi:hypothetical protein